MAFAIFLFKDRNGGFYMGVYVGYVEKKDMNPQFFLILHQSLRLEILR